jgi:CRP-like cAMP-binding protein
MILQTDRLSSFPIFDGLGKDDTEIVVQSLKPLTFAADQTILNEGDSIQALWIILSGKCVVSRTCSEDNIKTLAVLKPGDVFGEMSFVRSAPHSATIRTEEEVEVCRYDKSDFQVLTKNRPDLAMKIVANIANVLAERLRRMDTWVCDFVDRPEAEQHKDEWQVFRSAVYTNWSF